MLITISIPTYNRCGTLTDAITSALYQDYENIDVVVCDNCSDDKTEEIVRLFEDKRLRYYRQKTNVGIVENWITALSLVRGEYFLMLSDDDILLPNAVSSLLYTLLNCKIPHNEIAFVYGEVAINKISPLLDSIAKQAPTLEHGLDFQYRWLIGERNCYPSATLINTYDARKQGGYKRKYSAGVDVGLVFEMTAGGKKVCHTFDVTTIYAMHSDNFTTKTRAAAMLETIRELSHFSLNMDVFGSKAKKNDILAARAGSSAYFVMNDYRLGFLGLRDSWLMLWKIRDQFFGIHGILPILKAAVKSICYFRHNHILSNRHKN